MAKQESLIANATTSVAMAMGLTVGSKNGRRAGKEKKRNMSGQRKNNCNTSYRNRSVLVAENNRVAKSKC